MTNKYCFWSECWNLSMSLWTQAQGGARSKEHGQNGSGFSFLIKVCMTLYLVPRFCPSGLEATWSGARLCLQEPTKPAKLLESCRAWACNFSSHHWLLISLVKAGPTEVSCKKDNISAFLCVVFFTGILYLGSHSKRTLWFLQLPRRSSSFTYHWRNGNQQHTSFRDLTTQNSSKMQRRLAVPQPSTK